MTNFDFKVLADFDWYVAISRGGLAPAYRLAQLTGVKNIDTFVAYSYDDETHKPGRMQYLAKDYSHLRGKRVLLIDDLVDRGATMEFAMQKLLEFSLADLKNFVVYKKAHSTVRPDFYVKETPSDQWIEFSNNLEDLF